MSSASLRPRSPFFSFDSETGSRRPGWLIFLAGLLAVVLGLAGVAASVSAAIAHDKDYQASCFGLTIKLTNYNTSQPNTVSVVVDGVEKVPDATKANFGANYTATFPWDPSVSHTFAIVVDGWDGWDLTVPTTTQAPCEKPAVSLVGTVCNTTDGVTNLTATATKFASFTSNKGGFPSYKETYTGTLFKDGVPYKTVANVETDADGSFNWPGEAAGHVYTWQVKGNTNATLLGTTVDVKVVACPQPQDFNVAVNQCTATTGNNATVGVTAVVVPGREYSVQVMKDGSPFGGPTIIPASNTVANYPTINLAIPENVTGLSVVITDTAADAGDPNRTKQSITFATNPCPKLPDTPVVTADVCTVVGGTLALHVTFSGLVPGRAYDVLLSTNGGTPVKVFDLTATSSTYPTTGTWDHTVAAGTYVVTIVDELVPAAASSAASVEVKDCPTQPDISFTVTECQEAGGKGEISVTFTGLGVGREYTVTITENGNAVPGYGTAATVSLLAPLPPYTNLDPGKTYTVTVVDKLATGVKDAASIFLELCPMTPKLELTLECLFLDGESLISATIEDLAPGEDYLVEIEDDSSAGGLGGGTTPSALGAPVDSTTVTGGPDPTTVTFQVPNNLNYTVTVTKVTNSKVTNSAQIFAAICDLPTFPLPPELPTLALTGAGDTRMPMLGALGLVQFGVALLALAAMLQFAPRRRVS